MFLEEKDYLNIWEIGHRWAEFDPNSTDSENLPQEIRYFIHKLIEGYFSGDLKLRRQSGYGVPRDTPHILFWNINIWFKQMWKCLNNDKFDKTQLSNLFVRRRELLELCKKEDVEPPIFWVKKRLSENSAVKSNVNNRPKDEETDRLLCQAIACAIWELDPNIHPAHLAKSKVIQRFGHVRLYKDLDTIKKWISEVDPLKNQRNQGRPPDITYKINLEMDSLVHE